MDVESRSDSTNQSYATPGTLRATDAPNGYRVAILWRGDRETRRAATPHNNRYCRIFEELIALGIDAQPAVYADDYAHEVRAQLLACDGVLVWVDPIHEGRTREVLDPMLRDVAARGPWVSAHPDVILKMGVKEVLHRTRHLGWGTDTHLYRTADDFRAGLPERLGLGPRVIKQNRGNGGQGVWKVEAAGGLRGAASLVTVLHARRGSVPETLRLNEFFARCEPYFAAGGCIIDQPFQARLPDGMIRCYMGADKVVGFGHQLIKALIPPPADGPDSPAAQPGPRIMHGAEASAFPGVARQNGNRVDAADDGGVGHRSRGAAHHLGRRLSLRPADLFRRGHIRPVRNQCQLGLCHSRSGTGCHRATDIGPAEEQDRPRSAHAFRRRNMTSFLAGGPLDPSVFDGA